MELLSTPNTKVQVSSVLQRNAKAYGRQFLFDGSEETCWNSDQGVPQHITVDFERTVALKELRIMFQGGFAGRECSLLRLEDGKWTVFMSFYPDDINAMQILLSPDGISLNTVRIQFEHSTDVFGRITIYKCELLGSSV